MNALNSIIIEGSVNGEVKFEETMVGKFATVSIKVPRTYKNADGENVEELSFFDVDCVGNMAGYVAEHATKDRGLRIVGRLKQSRWTDTDGKAHSKISVVAEHIEFKPKPAPKQD